MDGRGESIYDPAAGLRGGMAYTDNAKSDDTQPDIAGDEMGDGLWNLKHQQFALSFNTGDGMPGALYSNFFCAPWRNKFKDSTEIRVWYKGILVEQGEAFEGDWQAVITGKRLDRIHDHLREGRRISINKTGPVVDVRKPQVDSIRIEKYEPKEQK